MTVLKSVLRDIIRPVLRPILRGGDDAITRFFTTLVASGSMSYAFAATLVSGTEITLTVYPTNGTQGLPLGAPAITDNKWQTITYTTTGNVDDLGFDGTNFFNGIIWDYSAPSINVAWSLAENFGETTVVKNSLAVLGPELWTNPPNILDTGWTDNGGGSYTLVGDGSFQNLGMNTITPNATVLIKFNIDSISGVLRLQGGSNQEIYTTTGPKESSVTVTGNVLIFLRDSGNLDVTLSNITFKQADGYGTAINISESDFFTQEPNGDYLGVELLALPTTVNAPWVDNGNNTYTAVAVSGQSIFYSNALPSGPEAKSPYLITATVNGSTVGQLDFGAGGDVGVVIVGNGAGSAVLSKTDSNRNFNFIGRTAYDGTMSLPSLKQLLEKA